MLNGRIKSQFDFEILKMHVKYWNLPDKFKTLEIIENEDEMGKK